MTSIIFWAALVCFVLCCVGVSGNTWESLAQSLSKLKASEIDASWKGKIFKDVKEADKWIQGMQAQIKQTSKDGTTLIGVARRRDPSALINADKLRASIPDSALEQPDELFNFQDKLKFEQDENGVEDTDLVVVDESLHVDIKSRLRHKQHTLDHITSDTANQHKHKHKHKHGNKNKQSQRADTQQGKAPPGKYQPLAAVGYPAKARQMLRAKGKLPGGPDPFPLVTPGGTSSRYAYDMAAGVPAQGRVFQACAKVVLRHGKSVANRVHVYNDIAYLYSPTLQAGPAPPYYRVNKQFHSGHIIGANLGGDDKDPLNFFPQHSLSNSGWGVWWRMERIAAEAQATILNYQVAHAGVYAFFGVAGPNDCQIMVRPEFDYANPNDWVPHQGVYSIELNSLCVLATALTPVPPAIRPTGFPRSGHIFWQWIRTALIGVPIPVPGLVVPAPLHPIPGAPFVWVNDIYSIPGMIVSGARFTVAWFNAPDNAANQVGNWWPN